MDKREEAKLNMARSVTKLLARPDVVTATTGTPAIGLAAGEVTDSIALIENLDTEASAAARGDGGSKAGLRQLALNTALIVDGKINGLGGTPRSAGHHQPLQPRTHRSRPAQRRGFPHRRRPHSRQGPGT